MIIQAISYEVVFSLIITNVFFLVLLMYDNTTHCVLIHLLAQGLLQKYSKVYVLFVSLENDK